MPVNEEDPVIATGAEAGTAASAGAGAPAASEAGEAGAEAGDSGGGGGGKARAEGDDGVPTGVDAGVEAVVVARRLALSGGRTIGLLPVRGRGDHFALLLELGAALTAFTPGPVGCIASWRRWDGSGITAVAAATAAAGGSDGDLVVVSPETCDDDGAAVRTLGRTLDEQRQRLGRVLVDLTGYGRPGLIPSAVQLLDGVALLVRPGWTRSRTLTRMAATISAARFLGAILVG